MAYNDVEILRDKNGNPIPQYYNVATGQFEPLTGENGATHTQLTGSYVQLSSTPVTGEILVQQASATELTLGTAQRKKMIAYNISDSVVYWGKSGVTPSDGFPLEPGDVVMFNFDSKVSVSIYGIADGSNVYVRMVEIA